MGTERSVGDGPARTEQETAPAGWVRADDLSALVHLAGRAGVPPSLLDQLAPAARGRRGARPHVDQVQDSVLVVVPTLTISGPDVLGGTVVCLLHHGAALTAEIGPADVLSRVAHRLEQPGRPAVDRLSGGFLPALLATLVAAASDVEECLADEVEELETRVLPRARTAPSEAVYALKREIAEARRGVAPLAVELPELLELEGEGSQAWLRRLSTAVDRLDHRLEAHDRLLADLLSTHLAQVSVQQNDDVRRISAWAAIAAAPTLIASVYGMNFAVMPELGWPWGYPAAIVVMVAVSAGLHRTFTRSGWL